MPILTEQKTVRTPEPALEVENRLEPGLHRFRLEVLGARGQRSVPDEIVVQVARVRGLPAGPATPAVPAAPAGAGRAVRIRKPGAQRP